MISRDDDDDDEEDVDKPLDHQSSSPSVESKQKRVPTECKICGGPALYSYVGVIACASCKMFFKRNSTTRQNELECRFDGQCEINLNTRHTCAACRLKKCFACGMQVDLLRGSTAKKGSRRRTPATTTELVVRTTVPEQLTRVDLLQSDRSSLTAEEWIRLSNLIHWYDECAGLAVIEQCIREQNQIPMRMRFKSSVLQDLLRKILINSQYLFEKNADFRSLLAVDRSLLLHRTIEHVSGLNCALITHASNILSQPTVLENLELLYGAERIQCAIQVMKHFDSDSVVMKVALGLIIFSTINLLKDEHPIDRHFQNVQSILDIQNVYIDLIWRYLLYRYDHERAVRSFSNLIRSLFALHRCLISADDVQQYRLLVESLIRETTTTLRLDET